MHALYRKQNAFLLISIYIPIYIYIYIFLQSDDKKEEKKEKEEEEDEEALIAMVLDKFSLSGLPSAEERSRQACLSLAAAVRANLALRTEAAEAREARDKAERKADTLQNLSQALRSQVDLVRTEGELRVREETQKRIECSKAFQASLPV